MSNEKYMNIARLIMTYNFEIDNEVLPDNLKCDKCKLVLKDACAVPCGCKFCRVCIDNLMASGSEFCPGVSEDCGGSLLSDFSKDYRANKSISKLAVKCPQDGCLYQCQVTEMEEHIRVCGRKGVACPFYNLGRQQDKLAAEEMSRHFQEENRSHCEILMGMITDINREMESHKREIEMLKDDDERNKNQIEMLIRSDENSKNQIEILKQELVMKDDQIRTIIDQLGHVENENKSMENEIKLIKEEKADLAVHVRILSEKIERQIDERRESDEFNVTNVIEHIDREITTITAVIGSNKDELDTAMRSVKDDIRSINEINRKSINIDIDFIKSQIQSIQALVGHGQIDASFEWTIDENVANSTWGWAGRTSDHFIGAVYPYKYRLASINAGLVDNMFGINLCIYSGPSDAQLPWPWSGTVVITVADRDMREFCQSVTLQCKIRKPGNNRYSESNQFTFFYDSLIEAGLSLSTGVCVSCVIVPHTQTDDAINDTRL